MKNKKIPFRFYFYSFLLNYQGHPGPLAADRLPRLFVPEVKFKNPVSDIYYNYGE